MQTPSVPATIAQAVLDSLVSLGSLALSFRFASVFYNRFLLKQSLRDHPAVRRLFLLVFALSLSLLLLVIFDALSLLHPTTRRINSLFVLYILVLLLIFVLPPAQLYHILLDLSWPPSNALRLSLLSEILFLILFSRILTPFSLDVAVSRILALGTTILALLSGFTAVHLPYFYLSSFIHPITESQVLTLSHNLRHLYHQILSHKRATHLQPRSSHLSTATPVLQLERSAATLFLRYNDASSQWRDVLHSRTLLGRASTILGALMLLLCAIRLILAFSNIYLHLRGIPNPSVSTSTGAALISRRLHPLLLHLGLHVDVAVVYQYATLAATSLLMCLNLRAVLLRMTSVFSLVAGHDILNSSIAIFLAHLMGTYVISSTVLMRTFLPPTSRVLITDLLGDVQFHYFQRWFDFLFISSALLAVLLLAYQSGYFATLFLPLLSRLSPRLGRRTAKRNIV